MTVVLFTAMVQTNCISSAFCTCIASCEFLPDGKWVSSVIKRSKLQYCSISYNIILEVSHCNCLHCQSLKVPMVPCILLLSEHSVCWVCKTLLLLKYLVSFKSFSLAATGDAILPSSSDFAAPDTWSSFNTFRSSWCCLCILASLRLSPACSSVLLLSL